MHLLHQASKILSRIVTGDTPDSAKIESLLNEIEESRASDKLIEVAQGIYQSDDVNVDPGATTSESEDGTWVSAWVWVSDSEIEDGLRKRVNSALMAESEAERYTALSGLTIEKKEQ